MADTYPSILHIENADLSNLGNLQIGIMAENDADLGFRLWGGKDGAGDVTHWLAKDEIARVQSLYILDLDVLDSDGIVKYDSDGLLAGAGELNNLADVVITTPVLNQALIYNGSNWVNDATTGTGDVVGPASATNEAIAIFDGTTGKLIKNSPMVIQAVSNNNRILIMEPNSPYAWKSAIKIKNIGANGLPGGQYIVVGNTASPLLCQVSSDPWIDDGIDSGRMLWENIKSDWTIYRRGTISAALADTASVLTLANTGTNGVSVDHYQGDRTPVGNVSGSPGDMYIRADDGVSSRVYQHRGAAANNTDWVELGVALVTADDVTIQKIGGTTTLLNVQDNINQFGMAGAGDADTAYITAASATTIDVAAGEGWLRSTDSHTGELFSVSWAASAGITIPINTVRYVGVEYNGGSPQISVRSSENWNRRSDFPLGTVVNQGDTQVHVLNGAQWASDFGARLFERFFETLPLSRAERLGGLIPSGSGRYLLMSSGELYDGFTEYDIASFDSTGSDRFDVYYRDGGGGWTGVASQSQWDNAYWDDGTGTLNTLTNNRFGNHWIYLEADGDIVLLYGRGDYVSLVLAEAESPPNPIPDRVSIHGRLLGRVTFQQGGASAEEIVNVWDTVFQGTGSGGGDFFGPSSATDESIVIFDGSTGKLGKNSVVQINDITDVHRIRIQEPTDLGWKDAIQIQTIGSNGLPGGEYVVIGNTDNPLLLQTDVDPWLQDASSYGRVLWERIKADWTIYRRGTISAALADTASVLTLTNTGTNGVSVDYYQGDRTPVGNVSAAPGSFYTRKDGVSSRAYQHRGAAANNTDWVETGSTYTAGTKTRTEMLALTGLTAGDTCYCSTYGSPFHWTGNTWQCDKSVEVINNAGITLVEGDVVVPSASVTGAVTTTTATYKKPVTGVVLIGGTHTSYITVAVAGTWSCYVSGSAALGDMLVTFSTAGSAASVGSTASAGVFAVVMQAKGAGLANIRCQIGAIAEIF